MPCREVALIATLETKAEEAAYLRAPLERQGLRVTPIDISLRAGGASFDGKQKLTAMRQIADETSAKLAHVADGAIILGLGGGTGGDIILRVFKTLPVSLPKVLVTTLPFDPRAAVAESSITIIPTIVDMEGLNETLRRILDQTAAMVSGLARIAPDNRSAHPSVGLTTLGVTKAAGDSIARHLREAGHEVTAFHANGFGGAGFIRFACEGLLKGVIDLTTGEAVRMHLVGAHVPMPQRFLAAAGLPRIVLPGALNLLDSGAYDRLTLDWRARPHYRHSEHFTHVKLNGEEIRDVVRHLAADLNRSRAHCEVLLPMGGFSHEDRPGGAIEDPTLREVAAEVFEAEARAYRVTRLAHHIHAPEVARQAVDRLLSHLNNRIEYP